MHLDKIFRNARVHTLDWRRPLAHSIGVFAGRIAGLDEELDGVTADEEIDLGGAPVFPGFHDAHFHLSLTGARLAAADLRGVSSLDALYEAVRAHASRLPRNAWVRAGGYDQNLVGGHPTAEGLDAVTGGRPALIEQVSSHMVVLNTAGFGLAGYPDRRGVPDVANGHVLRDADGRAIGLLKQQASLLAKNLVTPRGMAEVHENLALAGEQAVRFGLTSITEPGSGGAEMQPNNGADFHAYQLAVERDVLRTRVTFMPYITALHSIANLRESGWLGLDMGIRTGLGDDRLRMGPVKIVSDGSFIGRTAAMHSCYMGEPENTGLMQIDPDQLTAAILGAHTSGWTIAAHAIGDRALDHVLDAFAQAQARYPRVVRHRIEHFAYTTDAHVARAADLGLIPVPQGAFIGEFGDGLRRAVDGADGRRIYRMRSLLDAGIVLPGSTDSPVSNGNPLACIHDMVNRVTPSGFVLEPDERLTVEQAVRAYTYGSAYAVGQEFDKGALVRGMFADFVVLSDDLFQVRSAQINQQQVVRTVIGGETAFAL